MGDINTSSFSDRNRDVKDLGFETEDFAWGSGSGEDRYLGSWAYLGFY